MSEANPKTHPEKWIEEKAGEGAQKMRSHCEDLKTATKENPIQAIGIAFGVGYVARSLPLFRTAGVTLKGAMSLAPYVLAIIGAARAYEAIRDERAENRTPASDLPH